ncbi:MAG: outer membrane protein assembly factor BamD [Pseudomonadales bacterium]|nr:outer membrane protein assembly factor BamD [Pseudomonadales bacterium]
MTSEHLQSNVHLTRTLIRLGSILCLCSAFLLATGCATTEEIERSEKEYYDNARKALKSGNFLEATRELESLESRYPFGRYAEQAQLDLIYARYGSLDQEGSRAAADRFIRLHPSSENVDYAYYIRGIASYNMDIGLAAQWFPIDETSRDPGEMRRAFSDFSALLQRFPDSEYAPDARSRMVYIRNRLADYELHVTKYYIRREAYIAAVNRAKYIVDHFSDTPATEQALILMVELYQQLELPDKADDALVVLAANYPESEAFDANMKFNSNRVARQNRGLSELFNFSLFSED